MFTSGCFVFQFFYPTTFVFQSVLTVQKGKTSKVPFSDSIAHSIFFSLPRALCCHDLHIRWKWVKMFLLCNIVGLQSLEKYVKSQSIRKTGQKGRCNQVIQYMGLKNIREQWDCTHIPTYYEIIHRGVFELYYFYGFAAKKNCDTLPLLFPPLYVLK